MYRTYFGFRSMPFGNSLKTDALFMSATFNEAHWALRQGIDGDARVMLVSGVSGVGKTTLMQKLAAEPGFHETILSVPPELVELDAFTDFCCKTLEINAGDNNADALREEIATRANAGITTIILLDVGQSFPDKILENIVPVLGIDDSALPSARLIIAGQADLEARLADPKFAAIGATLDINCSLQPLKDADVGPYITRRLTAANYHGECLFGDDSIAVITELACGIPRRINTLCGAALLIVCDRDLKIVTPEILREVIDDLGELDVDVPLLSHDMNTPVEDGLKPRVTGFRPDRRASQNLSPGFPGSTYFNRILGQIDRYLPSGKSNVNLAFMTAFAGVTLGALLLLAMWPGPAPDGNATDSGGKVQQLRAALEIAQKERSRALARVAETEEAARRREIEIEEEQRQIRQQLAETQHALSTTRQAQLADELLDGNPSHSLGAISSSRIERIGVGVPRMSNATKIGGNFTEPGAITQYNNQIGLDRLPVASHSLAEMIETRDDDTKAESKKSSATDAMPSVNKNEIVAEAAHSIDSATNVGATIETEQTHSVAPRDTLVSNAKKIEAIPESQPSANGLEDDTLAVEQSLELPLVDASSDAAISDDVKSSDALEVTVLDELTEPTVQIAQRETPITTVVPAASSPDTAVAKSAADRVTVKQYAAEPGDSLFSIASRYGVKTADLREWNQLDDDTLQVGQVLQIGGDGGKKAAVEPTRAAALIAATRADHFSSVENEILAGAPINARDENGNTALMLAAGANYAAIAELLIDHNAKVNLRNKVGKSALSYAAWNGHVALSRMLLERGAKVDAKNKDGRTPLIDAAINGHAQCLQILLDNGAKVNVRTRDRRTALSAAVWNGHVEAARLLLTGGANVNTPSRDGRTPIMDAAWNGNAEMVSLLREHGADLAVTNDQGLTPLDTAMQRGHADVVAALE